MSNKDKNKVIQHGLGEMRKAQEDLKEKAAMSARMQRANEERQFLQDGEGAIIGAGLWYWHSVEPLL